MAIRDVNLDTRQTHIWVSGYQALYPRNDLFPDDDLFPSDRGVYLSNNIVAGTMKLDEIIVDGEQIVFGNLYSNKFEVQIYGEIVVDGEPVNVGDYDFSNQFIYVFQEDDGVYKQIFTGKVDSCKRNRDGYDKQIVAYDSAYLYNNQNIAPWWEDFWDAKGAGATATLGELRLSLLEYVGVRYSRVVLPNDSISIKKTVDLSSFSFGSCLRMMCEINCCFPHFSRDNILEFVVLDEEANAKNIENLYEAPSTTFEEFETQPITGIQFLNSDGELKYRVGTDANVYTVNGDNILLLDCDTAQLIAIGTNMLSYVSDLSYRPVTIKMVVGDLSYNLGDRLVTSQGTHYILQNSYSGPQFVEQEIRCDGQETIKEAGRTLDTTTLVLNQRIAKVVFDVEHFETEFTEYKEEIDGTLTELSSSISQNSTAITAEVTRATGAEEALSGRITVTAEAITSEVTRASGVENSLSTRITQTSEAITSEVTRATGAENSLSSTISQQADQIALKLDSSSYTHASIVAKINDNTSSVKIEADKINLTGYATFTSLSTSGQSTINGANITAGNITMGTNNGPKLVLDRSGSIEGYYNGVLNGRIIMTSDGIRMGNLSGSIFDSYLDILDNNIINIGADTLRINGHNTVSGTFVDKDNRTVTVEHGLITEIF